MAGSGDNPREPEGYRRRPAGDGETYELAHAADRPQQSGYRGGAVRRAAAAVGGMPDQYQYQGHYQTSVGSPAAATTTAPPREADPAKKKQSVLTSPPRRRGLLAAWLVMLVCLVVAAIPMIVDLTRPAVFHPAEARALVTATETWQRQAVLSYERWWSLETVESLIPYYDGRRRLDATPGATWMHLLAFQVLPAGPNATPTDAIILAGRAVSVVCGLLTVAAVFWIGICIGSLRTATLAALVAAAHPLLLYYSRLAGPEMPQLALATLTVAAAVWAIRPLKMPGSRLRQAAGWVLCGLCLGMAILTGGAGLLPFILVPVIFIFALYPNRLGHLMGLVAAVFLAALLTTPWALYTHEQDAATWQAWIQSLVPTYVHEPALLDDIAMDRLWLLLLATLPWTAWLAAGLLQPFSTSSAGSRLRMFLGWVWFVPVALLGILAPGQGLPREMLVVVPAAALLAGQVIRQYSDLSDEGRHARIWRLLRWPHCFVLMFASVAIPLVGELQAGMERAGWLSGPVSAEMGMGYWIGLGAVLLGIVLLSMRFAERQHPGRTVACWAVWVVVAVSMVAMPVARGPLARTELEEVGRVVERATSGAPLYWLVSADDGAQPADPRLVLYSRRRLMPMDAERLAEMGREPRYYVVADADHALEAPLEPMHRFDAAGLTLWRAVPAVEPAAEAEEKDAVEDAEETEAAPDAETAEGAEAGE
ncbi:MAG: ArnT family glycosyltransferase [Phycisphaeraceae bacterium]